MQDNGLTFFECISRGLGNQGNGAHIQHQLLRHFARLCFNFEGETLNSLWTDVKSLTVHHQCVSHPAIKQWIARIHSVQPCMSKSPSVWYETYRKALKGMALRFLHYHRDYARKPHRIFCTQVFSHLAADMYNCHLGFVKGGACRWFYPLDCSNYLCDDEIPTVIYCQDSRESFSLLPTGSYSVPLQLHLSVADEFDTMQCFSLRKSTLTHNTFLGRFKPLAEDSAVHTLDYPFELETIETDVYQIYPGDESKTFYTLSPGQIIIVYTVNQDNELTLCAEHKDYDNYIYFSVIDAMQCGVVLIVATSNLEARTILLRETKFTIKNS